MIKNTRAIDIVVNIWTAKALANRPDRSDFYKRCACHRSCTKVFH